MLHAFARWPTWMWANREVAELVEFLHAHNARHSWDRQVGFYGLDVYSLWESMAAVIEYLDRIDPEAASNARRAYGCFDRFHGDATEYARSTALTPTSCEPDVVRMLATLRSNAPQYLEDGRDAYFSAEQNALVAIDAERYYRAMIRGGPSSWNVRDHHMADTLDRLMKHHGPTAKAIVWEHNTHVGDARFTDMASDGMVNVGQLVRDTHGDEGVVIVGFSTHHGSVIASREWGAPMERMTVPPAREGSFEDAAHGSGAGDAFMLFAEDLEKNPELLEPLGHRAIGVVYRARARELGKLRADDRAVPLQCNDVHRRDERGGSAAHARRGDGRRAGDLPERNVSVHAAHQRSACTSLATRIIAARLSSTSSSVVAHELTLMRIAVRPCQTVPPHQHVPSA